MFGHLHKIFLKPEDRIVGLEKDQYQANENRLVDEIDFKRVPSEIRDHPYENVFVFGWVFLKEELANGKSQKEHTEPRDDRKVIESVEIRGGYTQWQKQ